MLSFMRWIIFQRGAKKAFCRFSTEKSSVIINRFYLSIELKFIMTTSWEVWSR